MYLLYELFFTYYISDYLITYFQSTLSFYSGIFYLNSDEVSRLVKKLLCKSFVEKDS